MDVGKQDLVVFVYTAAAMFTGAWVGAWGDPQFSPVVVAAMLVGTAAWTVYFRSQMVPRLERIRADEEDDDPAEDVALE